MHIMNSKSGVISLFAAAIVFSGSLVLLGVSSLANQSQQEIFQQVKPSIVHVVAGSSGTGTIISSNGCILTAAHVIEKENPDKIVSFLFSSDLNSWQSRSYEAELISFQAKSDFAIIQIDALEQPWVPIGDSSTVKELDEIISVGFPRPSALPTDVPIADSGVVQAIRQDPIEFPYGFGRDLYQVSIEGAIQVSGTIRPGSSGGPILNLDGEIISIISTVPERADLSNTAFTSPINLAGIPRICASIPTTSGFPPMAIFFIALGLIVAGSFGYWTYSKGRKPDVKKLLQSVSLFSALSKEELEDLRASCESKSFKKSDKIVREGEMDQDEMFLILSGQVDIQNQGRSLAKRGKGRIIGEAAMFSGEPRSADVIATELTHCLMLSKENLRQLIGKHPDIGMKMMQDLARRVREANELIK